MKDPAHLAKRLTRPGFLLKLNTNAWLILLGLDFLQSYSRAMISGAPYQWTDRLSFIIPHFFNLWLLSIPVYYIWNRWDPKPGLSLYGILFAGGLFFGSVHIALTYFDQILILRLWEGRKFTSGIFGSLVNTLERSWFLVLRSFLFYSLIIIALVAIDLYKRYNKQYLRSVELESQLSTARLKALKMQLHPHFLFNALNTISMMIRRNQGSKAVDMISGLSDMLRGTLWKSDKQLVPLEEELELVQKYLDIEKIRFKNKLNIEVDADHDYGKKKVPNLILLPIVENAFKHGTSERISASDIKISAKCNDERIVLSVYNDGPSLPSDFKLEENRGTGIDNTLDRLSQLYGSSYSFVIKNKRNGVQVTIQIPTSDHSL